MMLEKYLHKLSNLKTDRGHSRYPGLHHANKDPQKFKIYKPYLQRY